MGYEAGQQHVDGDPREEFKQRDTRRVHNLKPLLSMDDVRHDRKEQKHEDSLSGFQGLPRLRSARGFTEKEEGKKIMSSTWSPLAAAKAQLLAEKPDIYERLEKTVAHCKMARDNRKYRLDTLGVFDTDVNEVRSQSMFRVQMHQELSPVYMRLPQNLKDLKSALPDDSLHHKLERMYQRVLHSVDESKPHIKKSMRALSRSRRPQGASFDGSVALEGAGVLQRAMSGALQKSLSGHGGPALHKTLTHALSITERSLGGTVAQKKSAELKKASAAVHPELAEAQLQALLRTTEHNLERYHSVVAGAQQQLLLREGLSPDLMHCSPQELAAVLAGQLEEEPHEEEEQEQGDEQEHAKDVSQRLHHAQNIPDLITAALEHVDNMADELAELKRSLPPVVEESKDAKSFRRRSLRKLSSQSEAPSAQSSIKRGLGSAEGDGESAASVAAGEGEEGGYGVGWADELGVRQGASQLTMQQSERHAGAMAPGDSTWSVASMKAPAALPPPITAQRVADFTARLEAVALLHTPEPVAAASSSTPPPPAAGPPASPSAPCNSADMQARLERLWAQLLVPTVQRLDMVLQFTRRERVLQFGAGIELWEQAAALVLQREELLAELLGLREGLERATVSTLSVPVVERISCDIVQVSCQLHTLAARLKQEFGAVLEYKGKAYPGESDSVVGVSHLVTFMEYLAKYDGPVVLLV